MMHLIAQTLCLVGFAALAFAMSRTQRDVLGQRLPSAAGRSLRLAGSAGLLVACGVLVMWQGWALGLVMFSGHTSLAAGIVYAGLVVAARARLAV